MLNEKQAANFYKACAAWLEFALRFYGARTPETVYKWGKGVGFSRDQINAAKAWHGAHIRVIDRKWDFI